MHPGHLQTAGNRSTTVVEILILKKIRIKKNHFSWRNLGFCKKQCPKMELPKKQCKKQCIFSPILALFSIVFCKNQNFSTKNGFFWSGFFLASKSQLVLRFPGVCGGPRCTHNVQSHFPSVDPPSGSISNNHPHIYMKGVIWVTLWGYCQWISTAVRIDVMWFRRACHEFFQKHRKNWTM